MDTFYFALKKNKVIDAMKTCFKYALNNDHAFNHTCNFTNGKTNKHNNNKVSNIFTFTSG